MMRGGGLSQSANSTTFRGQWWPCLPAGRKPLWGRGRRGRRSAVSPRAHGDLRDASSERGVCRPRRPCSRCVHAIDGLSDPVGGGWSQTHVRYYIFALLFLIFDVEAVFIFPWAVQLESLGVFALVEMVIFITILLAGLVYAVRKGVLNWES